MRLDIFWTISKKNNFEAFLKNLTGASGSASTNVSTAYLNASDAISVAASGGAAVSSVLSDKEVNDLLMADLLPNFDLNNPVHPHANRQRVQASPSPVSLFANELFDIYLTFHLWDYYCCGSDPLVPTQLNDDILIAEDCSDASTFKNDPLLNLPNKNHYTLYHRGVAKTDNGRATPSSITSSNLTHLRMDGIKLMRGKRYEFCYFKYDGPYARIPNYDNEWITFDSFDIVGPERIYADGMDSYTAQPTGPGGSRFYHYDLQNGYKPPNMFVGGPGVYLNIKGYKIDGNFLQSDVIVDAGYGEQWIAPKCSTQDTNDITDSSSCNENFMKGSWGQYKTPKVAFIMQNYLGPNYDYKNMDCESALTKIFEIRIPPVVIPKNDSDALVMVNQTYEAGGAGGLTTTVAPGSSGTAVAATNSTGPPMVDVKTFFLFENNGHGPNRMFFTSVEDLSKDYPPNSTNIIFDFQRLELGSDYQICWQQTDGRWWRLWEDIPVQGPYSYNTSMFPLMGHTFELIIGVYQLGKDYSGVSAPDPTIPPDVIAPANVNVSFCDMGLDHFSGLYNSPYSPGVLGKTTGSQPNEYIYAFRPVDSGLQRLCWNDWTFTHLIVIGPEPSGEYECTRGNSPCTFTLNGTFLQMFTSRLGLFQTPQCSNVSATASQINFTELVVDRQARNQSFGTDLLEPTDGPGSGVYSSAANVKIGPFLYSNNGRADLPFVFDLLTSRNGMKMHGKYWVCLDAMSVWVDAGSVIVYGFANVEYLAGFYPMHTPKTCSQGEVCTYDLSLIGHQNMALSGMKNHHPMNFTLWQRSWFDQYGNPQSGNETLRYNFSIINESVTVQIRRGAVFYAKICGSVTCYELGIILDVTGPSGFIHIECALGHSCVGIDQEARARVVGRGLDLDKDRIGLVYSSDWKDCGRLGPNGLATYKDPPRTIKLGELFLDPPAAGYGGDYIICLCLSK